MSEQTAEIAALREKIKFYTDHGNGDSPTVRSLGERIKLLQELEQQHTETRAREELEFNARAKARSEGAGRWITGGDGKPLPEGVIRSTYSRKGIG